MNITETKLPGVKKIQPAQHVDVRGVFVESYQKARYHEAGIDCEFVQDNLVSNNQAGIIRGLHFQCPPSAQAKLISVLQGAILDVVADIRHGSPTFGKTETFQLNSNEGIQIYIPIGFAHGYCTLEDNTAVLYKVSEHYVPESEAGIIWNDPDLSIPWPVKSEAIIAERDSSFPRLSELEKIFSYA